MVRDENGKMCREVRNVGVTVLNPLRGWPIPGSGWNTPALEEYAKQLLKPEDSGFDYTYGRRLRQYPISWWKMGLGEHDIEQDQLKAVISRLRHSPSTRRAVAITWIPEQDNAEEMCRVCRSWTSYFATADCPSRRSSEAGIVAGRPRPTCTDWGSCCLMWPAVYGFPRVA